MRPACVNVSLRQGDIYAPPVERNAYDLVVIHQVLHFLDDPARALGEAARALAPGGRLAVVDFDAHDQEFLRDEFAHRRLGFAVAGGRGLSRRGGPRQHPLRSGCRRPRAKRAS